MSLTYSEIEEILLNGVSFDSNEREFIAKAREDSDVVVITELTARSQLSVPLEAIVDRAEANHAGSCVADIRALKRLLGDLMAR